jgi:hypothetical protein
MLARGIKIVNLPRFQYPTATSVCQERRKRENESESISDELVKSRNSIEFVIPAKAGIQLFQDVLDPGFRRGDVEEAFCEIINKSLGVDSVFF